MSTWRLILGKIVLGFTSASPLSATVRSKVAVETSRGCVGIACGIPRVCFLPLWLVRENPSPPSPSSSIPALFFSPPEKDNRAPPHPSSPGLTETLLLNTSRDPFYHKKLVLPHSDLNLDQVLKLLNLKNSKFSRWKIIWLDEFKPLKHLRDRGLFMFTSNRSWMTLLCLFQSTVDFIKNIPISSDKVCFVI